MPHFSLGSVWTPGVYLRIKQQNLSLFSAGTNEFSASHQNQTATGYPSLRMHFLWKSTEVPLE